jgi:hypothetical protein
MKIITKEVIQLAINEQEQILKRATERRESYKKVIGNEDRLIQDCIDNIANLKKDLEYFRGVVLFFTKISEDNDKGNQKRTSTPQLKLKRR